MSHTVPISECPNPSVHGRPFRYCPYCEWREHQEPMPKTFDLIAHLDRQVAWSLATFGPGDRAKGVIDHLRKELREVEAAPTDLSEWIDVAILAFDGAWRSGATPEQIADALAAKQSRNEKRQWPDWRTMPTDRAIEHVRDGAQ